jgi:hypothetical protein
MAVNDGQKWFYDEGEHEKLRRANAAEMVLCPGHERIEKRRIDGVVNLRGQFLKSHQEEALNLINNIADQQLHRNVAARVFNISRKDSDITVETTDKHLAEKIGKAFEQAFQGNLAIQWLPEADFVRVNWQRD